MNNQKNEWEKNLSTIRKTMQECSNKLWALRPIMEEWKNWSQMITARDIIGYVCYTIDTLEESINTEDE